MRANSFESGAKSLRFSWLVYLDMNISVTLGTRILYVIPDITVLAITWAKTPRQVWQDFMSSRSGSLSEILLRDGKPETRKLPSLFLFII